MGDAVVHDLVGQTIGHIFKCADEIAELHACLTSPRRDNFRFRLLQALEVAIDETAIEQLRKDSGVNEYHRHLNQLLKYSLVRIQQTHGEPRQYSRTVLGERAVNVVRELERRVGPEAAHLIYSAVLGPNSIRLFLRIYGDQREVDWDQLQITYTPVEIGKLSLFLPRTIEGISAIDKLNEADILVYQDDNQVHMQPLKARGFYQYLQGLRGIIAPDNGAPENGDKLRGGPSRI